MTLRPGTRADVRAAAAVFGRSFHTTPQWEWLIPDERARAGVLPAFFRSSFGHVRRHGRLMVAVDDADTVVGAIAWSAPGQWKTPAWRGVLAAPALLRHLAGRGLRTFAERGRRIDAATHAAHPTEEHWYLAGVAVDPAAQTGGVGTALIREGLDVADSQGQPVYLECVEELIPYYERFGFAVTGRIEPGQVGMWRQVRSGRTS